LKKPFVVKCYGVRQTSNSINLRGSRTQWIVDPQNDPEMCLIEPLLIKKVLFKWKTALSFIFSLIFFIKFYVYRQNNKPTSSNISRGLPGINMGISPFTAFIAANSSASIAAGIHLALQPGASFVAPALLIQSSLTQLVSLQHPDLRKPLCRIMVVSSLTALAGDLAIAVARNPSSVSLSSGLLSSLVSASQFPPSTSAVVRLALLLQLCGAVGFALLTDYCF
jgi:hypothetical protein